MSDADTFLREHRPSFDYTRGGEYIAVCAGCTRAAGDYIEWPCAHIWGAADVLARRDDLLAEAWQEGRNSVARDLLQPTVGGFKPATPNPYLRQEKP